VTPATFRSGLGRAAIDEAVDAFVESVDEGSLKAAVDANVDPDWDAAYGDHAWDAAIAQLGITRA
jgi:hypothetical protein